MDRYIEERRPNVNVINKAYKTCQLIDVACPGDKRVKDMDDGEISKLQDLAREIQKIVNMKLEAYPVVIGALGMMPA